MRVHTTKPTDARASVTATPSARNFSHLRMSTSNPHRSAPGREYRSASVQPLHFAAVERLDRAAHVHAARKVRRGLTQVRAHLDHRRARVGADGGILAAALVAEKREAADDRRDQRSERLVRGPGERGADSSA